MQPFDLNIQSFIPLSGVEACQTDPDLVIQEGQVPGELDNPALVLAFTQTKKGKFLLNYEPVGRFLVEDGRRITVQPAAGANEDEIRLFLQGAVWGPLLLQRGLLALHASAVKFGDSAILFSGNSGAGKSSLAAEYVQRGFPFIADEVCAIRINPSGRAEILPGFPQLLLWKDTVRHLGLDIQQLDSLRPDLQKYALDCSQQKVRTALPVSRLVVLKVINTPDKKIEALAGPAGFEELSNCTYGILQVKPLDIQARHFQNCVFAARSIQVLRMMRPQVPFDPAGLFDMIESAAQ